MTEPSFKTMPYAHAPEKMEFSIISVLSFLTIEFNMSIIKSIKL